MKTTTRPSRAAKTIPWREGRYVALDLETTGLDLRHDDIVSVGAVSVTGGAIDTSQKLYTLMRPVRRVSAESIKVHGLRADDLFDAPNPSQVAAMIRNTCQGAAVIAHAAWIETAMLSRLARGTRTSLVLPSIDTAALARAGQLPSLAEGYEPSLEQVAKDLQLPVFSPHHALGDALTTAVVFLCLATRLERTAFAGGMSVADLVSVTTRDAQRRASW